VTEAVKSLQGTEYKLENIPLSNDNDSIGHFLQETVKNTWQQQFVGVGRDGVVRHNGIKVCSFQIIQHYHNQMRAD
jgi:hypothetical protein